MAGFNASNTPKVQRPIPPAGTHIAVCYSIIDIGTHMKSFQGQQPVPTPLVNISWEFTHLPHQIFDPAKGPQPMAIFQEYTLSIKDKAKLAQILKVWGGITEITNLETLIPKYIGAPCMIQVVHNRDKTQQEIIYANIAGGGRGVMQKPKDMPYNKAQNPQMLFELTKFSWAQFHKIPPFIQNKIKQSQEWSEILAKFGAEPAQVQNTAQNHMVQQYQQSVQNQQFQPVNTGMNQQFVPPPVQQSFVQEQNQNFAQPQQETIPNNFNPNESKDDTPVF